MIVADVLGPWHDVEATDADGHTYRDVRRLPQFLHDVSASIEWRDGTNQRAESIPPTPGLCVWRVWTDEETLAEIAALPAYRVLNQAEVERAHQDPVAWPVMAAPAVRAGATDAFPPLPTSGALEAGAIYQYGAQAVIVRQSHNRTEHDPATVPALFMVYRADAAATLAWIAGEQVQVGTVRTYGGVMYRALQAHVTQSDWTPPATPALWAVVVEQPPVEEPPEEPTTPAWAVGVAYKVGDLVTYNGVTYSCRQAHTSIATWTPPAVLALWLPM